SDPSENPVLAQKTVQNILKHFGLEQQFGAKIETTSNIPVARGLKSSSAAANAIALATITVLKQNLEDISLVKIGVNSAINAKVTITGAFDDACASFFGGVVITDNNKLTIIKRFELTEIPTVLFYVPEKKTYTVSSNVKQMKSMTSIVKIAFKEALNGNYWQALTLNGLIYSSTLGLDPSPAIDALKSGALAAGLSGTGPAVTAIVPEEIVGLVKDSWQKYEGDILEARINQEKARVIN
ncbi:shikimate kinase, partial [Candidatus Bathyarchaeota archaeon]|nr:shikimate kinase [Candidatus Bathyarchaeota archaeon]